MMLRWSRFERIIVVFFGVLMLWVYWWVRWCFCCDLCGLACFPLLGCFGAFVVSFAGCG